MDRIGFGQVEPNHLSAMRTHQIYAQLPAAASINVLENGQFAKYDYAAGEVNFAGEGEFMLVLNEVKLYDGYRETYKDFALQTKDFTDGKIYPRLYKTNIGDIITTNCLEAAGTKGAKTSTVGNYTIGTKLTVNAQGFLEENSSPEATDMVWVVVTPVVGSSNLPDGQEAVKIQRIQ